MGVDEKTLGKRLQLARRRAGLTQQELCQKAGLSYSTLAKIERGAIRSPSVFTVASIAKATSTTIEDLLGIKSTNLSGSPSAKKTSKTGVRFVYFDIGGTLLHFHHKIFSQIAEDAQMPVDRVETVFWRFNDTACSGKMSLAQFNQALAKEFGLKEFNWVDYYLKTAEISKPSIDMLGWVTANYDVGLLTNQVSGLTDQILQKSPLADFDFTAVVDSAKVGAIKPQAKIYQIAEQMASVKPNEILLIDNERPNLTAADRAGWQVLWFDDLRPVESAQRAKKTLEF